MPTKKKKQVIFFDIQCDPKCLDLKLLAAVFSPILEAFTKDTVNSAN